MDHLSRQKTFQKTIEGEELDGFVVTHPANLRYLCGYSGSNGLLLFLDGRRVFFTDGRYTSRRAKKFAACGWSSPRDRCWMRRQESSAIGSAWR